MQWYSPESAVPVCSPWDDNGGKYNVKSSNTLHILMDGHSSRQGWVWSKKRRPMIKINMSGFPGDFDQITSMKLILHVDTINYGGHGGDVYFQQINPQCSFASPSDEQASNFDSTQCDWLQMQGGPGWDWISFGGDVLADYEAIKSGPTSTGIWEAPLDVNMAIRARDDHGKILLVRMKWHNETPVFDVGKDEDDYKESIYFHGSGTAYYPRLLVEYNAPASGLFWTDSGTDHIEKLDHDLNRTVLASGADGVDTPRQISVNSIDSRIYWADKTTIRRSNIDGSSLETVLDTNNIPAPNLSPSYDGVVVDIVSGHIYCADSYYDRILMADYNGDNSQVIWSGTQPLGSGGFNNMTIDPINEYVYWSESHPNIPDNIMIGPSFVIQSGTEEWENSPLHITTVSGSTVVVAAFGNTLSNSDVTGRARVGIIDGDTVTWGDAVTFRPSGGDAGKLGSQQEIKRLDDTHVIVGYSHKPTDPISGIMGGFVRIGTISGDTITFGDQYEFNTKADGDIRLAVLDSTHAVIMYRNGTGGGPGTPSAKLCTVDGTTVTFGDMSEFDDTNDPSSNTYINAITPLDSSKVLAAYVLAGATDGSHHGSGILKVGTINGTDIVWGAGYAFPEAPSGGGVTSTNQIQLEAMDSDIAVFSHYRVNKLAHPDILLTQVWVVSIDGDEITFGEAATLPVETTRYVWLTKLTSDSFLMTYRSDPPPTAHDGYSKVVLGVIDGTSIILDKYVQYRHKEDAISVSVVAARLADDKFIAGWVDYTAVTEKGTARCVIGSLFNSFGTFASSGSIHRINYDGSNHTIMASVSGEGFGLEHHHHFKGISIHVGDQDMYWANQQDGKIEVSGIGSDTVTTVIDSLSQPVDVSVDSLNSKLYWVDSLDKTISRSSLSGTNISSVINNGLINPNSVTGWIP